MTLFTMAVPSITMAPSRHKQAATPNTPTDLPDWTAAICNLEPAIAPSGTRRSDRSAIGAITTEEDDCQPLLRCPPATRRWTGQQSPTGQTISTVSRGSCEHLLVTTQRCHQHTPIDELICMIVVGLSLRTLVARRERGRNCLTLWEDGTEEENNV